MRSSPGIALPRFIASLALLASLGGCSSPTEPDQGDPPLPPGLISIHQSPAWSPAGDTIAYQQTVASSDGPPGVYLVAASGSAPRLLFAGDALGPTDLRYSPDGTHLAASWDGDIVVLDARTGAISRRIHTDNFAVTPDWSPDGTRLLFSRAELGTGQTVDSTGLALYDVASQTIAPVQDAGSPALGYQGRWSPDGSRFVWTFANVLMTCLTSGAEQKVLTEESQNVLSSHPQWIKNGSRILYLERRHYPFTLGDRFHNRVMSPDGSGLVNWPAVIGFADAIAPDESQVVVSGLDPTDSSGVRIVLFVQGMTDATGTSRRQLTSYVPPSLGTALPAESRARLRRPVQAVGFPGGYFLRGTSNEIDSDVASRGSACLRAPCTPARAL